MEVDLKIESFLEAGEEGLENKRMARENERVD